MEIQIDPVRALKGSPVIPGDKSISHRAQLLAALAVGTSEIVGLSNGEDVTSTRKCLTSLGVKFDQEGDTFFVHGVGLRGLKASGAPLDCGNSGSTIRMLMGILAGQSFTSTLIGDASLSKRPMGRVADPLREMGARIDLSEGKFCPMKVAGVGKLKAKTHSLKVASAQVKSAILLAALYADGETALTGKIRSRDHTEKLLPHFGGEIAVTSDRIALRGGQTLKAAKTVVPGDPSSAAFWLAAAAIVPGGHVTLKNILLNPTRTGFQSALKRMGATLTERVTSREPELVGEVEMRHSSLKGISITAEEVASLIDELPMLAVLAAYATGVTEVRGAEELRVKETDRIEAVAAGFRALGGKIETFEDGFRIVGPQKLGGGTVDSFHDHRIAMAFAIGALGATAPVTIRNAESVNISYPAFFPTLRSLTHG